MQNVAFTCNTEEEDVMVLAPHCLLPFAVSKVPDLTN